MFYLFIFIIGLIIGSFVNVVICRLSDGRRIFGGRSRCPECGQVLGFSDLIPVFSWLFLRGRCRYCHKPISSQYILVELAMGILFVLGYAVIIGPSGQIAGVTLGWWLYYLVAVSFLLVIFVFDWRHGLIPDKVSIPLMIIAVLFSLFLKLNMVNILLSGVLGAGWFAGQYFLSRGRWIGAGDIRLGAALGLLLGWPKIILALLLAYIIGSLAAAVLLLSRKKNFGSQIAFGTFLSLAAVVTWLWGDNLLVVLY